MAAIPRNTARAKAIADRITAQIRRALPHALEAPRDFLAARLKERLNAPSGNQQPLVDLRIVGHALVVSSSVRRTPARKPRGGFASPRHQKQKPGQEGSDKQPPVASTLRRSRSDLQQLVKQGLATALQASRRVP